MKHSELYESRFWVLARKPPARLSLPRAWSNVLSKAIAMAKVVERCGLEAVRVVDRRAPPFQPTRVWPLQDELPLEEERSSH